MELNSTLDRLLKYEVIDSELRRAKEKHPNWNHTLHEQIAVMMEEAGESVRAVNEYVWFGGSIDDVKKELIQTAAMCMRIVESLPTEKGGEDV